MANEISLVTASGRTVTPKDDGIIYEVFSPGDGIIYGGAVTIKDSSTLHITAGHGIVCGRKFTIDDSDIPVALSGSGSLLGRLYIHLDLADAADPITLLVETGASLTPVVQDSDVNINNGVYEINIATFDVDTTTISNLVNLDVTVAPMGDMEGATAGTDGKGGYVPAPQAGDEDKVLRGDGTWGAVSISCFPNVSANTVVQSSFTSGQSYTFNEDVAIIGRIYNGTDTAHHSGAKVYINGILVTMAEARALSYGANFPIYFPIKKGDSFTIESYYGGGYTITAYSMH